MMPIDKAIERLGDKESPPKSNRTLYGKWFGMDGQPWCMFFVQWCYAMAGYSLPYRTGSCAALLRWYEANMPSKIFPSDALTRANDIIIYKFGHTGLIEEGTENGRPIKAIEGNTSADDKGSQDNGGMVCRKIRNRSLVTAFIRPFNFKEEVETMTIPEFIEKLTPEQAYKLLSKAMTYTDKKEQPAWSKQEGYWDKALASNIVKVNNPESLIKRGEMVTILGRLGIIK